MFDSNLSKYNSTHDAYYTAKKNFLLIMPRVASTVGGWYMFPLGLPYISSAMKKSGLNVYTLNLNHIKGDIVEIIKNKITDNSIDIVMTGGVSPQFNALKRIVDYIYNTFPHIKIIVGGGIITADPYTAMTSLEHVNYGVIGEGEITSVELSYALQGSKEICVSDIAGLIHMDNGKWTQTKPRSEIDNLDSLPFPDYDGFGLNEYLELEPMSILNVSKKRIFYILGSRSCPYQCTFCFHTTGNKYRQRSIENVIDEMEMLVKKYDITHITFSDELFARKKERVKMIEDASQRLGITWSASFRVDDIDDELINMLKNGNCISMYLGLESASNKILKSMRKKITIEQADKALQLIYNSGIPTAGNFIFGDIEETVETVNETLDYWEKNRKYNINLSFIEIYPGTHLYKYALENGIITDPVKFLKDGCPQINVSKLTSKDFAYLTEKIYDLNTRLAIYPKDWELVSAGKSGRISLKGKCISCDKENIWSNALLFSSSNWINCSVCGQKHVVPFPDEIKSILFNNISHMCKNNKVGLWGVSKYTFSLFNESDTLDDENIIFIDNNAIQKQGLEVRGKKVYSPDKAFANDIDTVIFFYPSIYAITLETVKQKFPNIKRFINVYDLLST